MYQLMLQKLVILNQDHWLTYQKLYLVILLLSRKTSIEVRLKEQMGGKTLTRSTTPLCCYGCYCLLENI